MTVARSTRETFDYVLKCDRDLPTDQQTVFTLRRLSNATMLQLENLLSIDQQAGSMTWRSGDAKIVALRAGLVGWKNLRDEHGNEVAFKREEAFGKLVHGVAIDNPVALEALDHLRTEDAREIADAIVAGNQLTKADAKN